MKPVIVKFSGFSEVLIIVVADDQIAIRSLFELSL